MSGYATTWSAASTREIRNPLDLLDLVSRANKGSESAKAWLKQQESTVCFFSVVTTSDSRHVHSDKFILVPDGYRDLISFEENVLSVSAPIGSAVKGSRIGDEINHHLPNGAIRKLEIINVEMLSEERLSKLCQDMKHLEEVSNLGIYYVVDYRYNVYPIGLTPVYVHGSGPTRHRMGG